MNTNRPQLVTKDQLQAILDAWNVDEKPPKKDMKVVVVWPTDPKDLITICSADITVWNEKNTDGKRLYAIQFQRRGDY